MKTITIISLLLLFTGVFSCKKKTEDPPVEDPVIPVQNDPAIGKSVLYYGTDSIIVQGSCNGDNNLSYYVISLVDAQNQYKTMNVTFNNDSLPDVTTTFDLVPPLELDQDNEATIYFANATDGGELQGYWISDDNSGALTLTVNGNKVIASFDGVSLPFNEGNSPPPYNVNGTLKGSFLFYK